MKFVHKDKTLCFFTLHAYHAVLHLAVKQNIPLSLLPFRNQISLRCSLAKIAQKFMLDEPLVEISLVNIKCLHGNIYGVEAGIMMKGLFCRFGLDFTFSYSVSQLWKRK